MVLKRVCVLLLALLAFTGCSAPEELEDRESEEASSDFKTFIGTVEGTEANVALVFDGEKVAGFVTDGASISDWLRPVPAGDGLGQLLLRDTGAFEGAVEFFEGGVRGEVNIDGAPYSFEALPATGKAGIHWVEEEGAESGWIVSDDGSVKGVKSQGGVLSDPGPPKGPLWNNPISEPFQPK